MTEPIIDFEALERLHAQNDAQLEKIMAGFEVTRELMEQLRESQIKLEATLDRFIKHMEGERK
jgi:hypothetical protein